MKDKKNTLQKALGAGAKAVADKSANSSIAWIFHQKKCPDHLLKKD